MKKVENTTNYLFASLTRRDFIKSSSIGAIAILSGLGTSGVYGKSPALIKKRTVHIIAWNHFIKETDQLMRNELIPEFKKATGVDVSYETVELNDLNPRILSAISKGEGPDIFQLNFNMPHLYSENLANHDNIVSNLDIEDQYTYLKEAAKVDGIFRGVPYYGVGTATAYRTDIFKDLNITSPPETWQDYLSVGTKLKESGMPVGQTLGHTFADAPGFTYPLLWSFGGCEVDTKGNVAINSRETYDACVFLKEFWNAACDEGGLVWGEASNNRAFLAGTIGATLNGASIYIVARNNPEVASPGLADNIGHFLNPQGPHGRYHMIMPLIHSIAQYSQNKEVAGEFIQFLMEKSVYDRYILVQKGYGLGATPDWENHPIWKEDPAMEPFRLNSKYGRNFGWKGPYNRKASDAHAKYIITDLFANVVKGGAIKDSIAEAEWALKKIYN